MSATLDVPELSREQLATLIPVCPLLMDWLRNATVHTADLFQQSYEEDYDSVAFGLEKLIICMQDSPNIPYITLAKICAQYRVSVWANALRLILTQSHPKLVPEEVGSDLVGTIPRLNGACTVNEVCHILGPLLDKLPRSNFTCFAEFCALLRDTGSSSTHLACLVGPQLLLPNLLINSAKNQGPGALAAAAVMELLIKESESLFGRCASRRSPLPFGEFGELGKLGVKDARKADAFISFERAALDPNNVIAKSALRAFYDWRDPVKSSNTERLFKKLTIIRIAEGLQNKYGLIPPGWGIIMRVVINNEAPTLQPGQKSMGGTARLLPGEVNADYARLKNASTFDAGSKGEFNESEKMKLIIKEVCDTENNYYNILNTFMNTYCEKLQAILQGRDGDIKTLGLTVQDVEAIFGKKLTAVKDVSHKFVVELDLLTDFQGQQNIDGRGRLGMLIDAFMEILQRLDVLGPYMSTYSQVIKLINERKEEIRKGKGKRKRRRTKGQNFLELWELERVKHENLRLMNIETILIKPIQKVPQYKVLLKELIDTAKKDNHPCLEEVKSLYDKIEALGHKIDRQVDSTSNKAQRVLGI